MKIKEHTLKVGLLPTRRNVTGEFFCNLDVAQANKKAVEKALKEMKIDYVNINFLNPEGIIYNGLDAEKVADYFIAQKVDAVFAPHCNFGTEDAVAKVGKMVGKPLLLWAIRDESPDSEGNRCTDSQCGIMATSKVLRQFGVPFTYMTNCSLDDPAFKRTMDSFLRAAQIVKSMTNLRIGQIGVRPDAFWSVKCNELQLLEKLGIEVVPVTMIELKERYEAVLKKKEKDIRELIRHYRKCFDVTVNDDALMHTAALELAIWDWAGETEVSAIASNCWGPMRSIGGVASCFVFSELTDAKLPVVCETDIHGAITSVIAQASTMWKKASFFADITIRHPSNDNAELFWHCGVFPGSTAGRKKKPQIGVNFDEGRPTVGNFALEEKLPVTLMRMDCSEDRYSLLIAEGKTVKGPRTKGTYGWIEFKDWPRLEHKVVEGPYIHHVAGVEEAVAPALYEACRYMPSINADLAEPSLDEVLARLR